MEFMASTGRLLRATDSNLTHLRTDGKTGDAALPGRVRRHLCVSKSVGLRFQRRLRSRSGGLRRFCSYVVRVWAVSRNGVPATLFHPEEVI